MFIHTDQDGNRIPFCKLTDTHLEGIICFLCNKLIEAKNKLNGNDSKFMNCLYSDIVTMNYEKANVIIKTFEDVIAPYIYEAVLRDLDHLDEIRDRLWKLLERETLKKEIVKSNALEYTPE